MHCLMTLMDLMQSLMFISVHFDHINYDSNVRGIETVGLPNSLLLTQFLDSLNKIHILTYITCFTVTDISIPYFLNRPAYVDHPDPFFKSTLRTGQHSLKYTGKNASWHSKFVANWCFFGGEVYKFTEITLLPAG